MIERAEAELEKEIALVSRGIISRSGIGPDLKLLPTPSGRSKWPSLSFLRDPGSLVGMAVIAFVFYNQIVRGGFPPKNLPNVFSAALIGGAIVLFAIRRMPTAKGNALDAILARIGTVTMAFMALVQS